MITLENALASAVIKKQGAELCSLFDKENAAEYIWQAEEIWPKHAPILFPIVGALKNGRYVHEGAEYSLPRHGFARDALFTAIQLSSQEAVFTLSSTEETLKVYPFPFLLTITYTLQGKILKTKINVSNSGEKPMFFSFGLHPAFNLCSPEGEGIEDIAVQFAENEALVATAALHEDGTHTPKDTLYGQQSLAFDGHTFDNDALIFEHLQSRSLLLRNTKNGRSLSFSWSGSLPIFALWSKPGAPFICLEPWAGICDLSDSDGIFIHKKGILCLQKISAAEFAAEICLNP